MRIKKVVIIINGKGGVGKDTLCDIANEHFRTKTISSIDPVKTVAQSAGWNGEKNPKARRFLSDLKRLMIEYNDLPMNYLLTNYEIFSDSSDEILFCHIRESEEIDRFKNKINAIPCVTLLVQRDNGVKTWGNSSDDDVENYEYDYVYDNNLPIAESQKKFVGYLKALLDSVDYPKT